MILLRDNHIDQIMTANKEPKNFSLSMEAEDKPAKNLKYNVKIEIPCHVEKVAGAIAKSG
jgi:hypothetical protein